MGTPTVVLFDVDGTLVLTGGAGRRAMNRAFDEIVGRPDALDGIPLGGMTDRLIMRTGLARVGRPFEEPVVERLLARYLAYLREELPRAEAYEVMPGAPAAVAATRAREGFAVGLGTGNVREGALLKLERAGLADAFPFGGFGCDAEDRTELIRAGAERGAAFLGRAPADCRVVIVGDTPRDVEAALGIGAVCVAVATGAHDVPVLREAGATHAFEDLLAEGALDAILGA